MLVKHLQNQGLWTNFKNKLIIKGTCDTLTPGSGLSPCTEKYWGQRSIFLKQTHFRLIIVSSVRT